MGLDYLNKKVWHPGSMKNIQKVWDAQQAQLQVIKRQKQRAKKLQDQQYNQEMKRIQVEAGLIPRSHLDRMDWMYDLGNKLQQQKNSEQFLTGTKKANKKEIKHIFQEEATNRKCEDFVLLHQDPLYAIQRQQMRARQSIMNNPIEMRSIIQEVEEDYIKRNRKEKETKRKRKNERSTDRNSSAQKSKNSRKISHSRSSSSSSSSSSNSSSSSSEERSREKKSKSSKLYDDYLKKQFGGILKKDESGKLVPDYRIHKKKYQTQMELDEQQRRQKLQKMRQNARKMKQSRDRDRDHSVQSEQKQKGGSDYQRGLAKIRQKSYDGVRENRNKRGYKQQD